MLGHSHLRNYVLKLGIEIPPQDILTTCFSNISFKILLYFKYVYGINIGSPHRPIISHWNKDSKHAFVSKPIFKFVSVMTNQIT